MRYKEVKLGRMAVFLIPSVKARGFYSKRRNIEDKINKFLEDNYSGYTVKENVKGFWTSTGRRFYGEHIEYKASFIGKERIPALKKFLALIAHEINEECIYLETGEDSFLIYPDPIKKETRPAPPSEF